MLLELQIKNVALIEEVNLEFHKGLNVLSGETGAGKSVIIDSISFVLGGRGSKDFIRHGKDKAFVEAIFKVNDEIKKIILNMDIECEDNILIIQRTLNKDGRNICKINGVSVTTSNLKKVSENLIDFHGQHDHRSLLDKNKQLEILDNFCGNKLDDKKLLMASYINEYKIILEKLKALDGDDGEREEKIQLLNYKISQIKEANLKENEEEGLIERKNYLTNIEKISKLSTEITTIFYTGGEESPSVIDNINKTVRILENLLEFDEKLKDCYDLLLTVTSNAEDIGRTLRQYSENINYSAHEMEDIEERLHIIYSLKKKYGKNISDIINYKASLESELDKIINGEKERKKLKIRKNELYELIKVTCEEMSVIRKNISIKLSEEIEKNLKDLEMKNAKFAIAISQKETFNKQGFDVVDFLISPNLGEDLKPVLKVASGGEMSRVMLALKTVISKGDVINTFIFDEIDAGISGNTASKVGKKMSEMGMDKQILAISHLPQIGSMAHCHFLIYKEENLENTLTNVIKLDETQRVNEISRLMGGQDEAIKDAAKQMLKNAKLTLDNYKRG